MRLTVLQQTAKGLPEQTRDEEVDYPLRDPVVRNLDRLKWYVWHGNVYKALQVVQSVAMDLDAAVATSGHGMARQLLTVVEECQTSIANNHGFIPHDGERYRAGERISTGVVESTGNHVIGTRCGTTPQMAWTPCGAHLLLQIPDRYGRLAARAEAAQATRRDMTQARPAMRPPPATGVAAQTLGSRAGRYVRRTVASFSGTGAPSHIA
jgi:hypothetical protein